jgi:hypothetical protein
MERLIEQLEAVLKRELVTLVELGKVGQVPGAVRVGIPYSGGGTLDDVAYGVRDRDVGFGEGGEGRRAELWVECPVAMSGNVGVRASRGEVAPVAVMGSVVVGPGREEDEEET